MICVARVITAFGRYNYDQSCLLVGWSLCSLTSCHWPKVGQVNVSRSRHYSGTFGLCVHSIRTAALALYTLCGDWRGCGHGLLYRSLALFVPHSLRPNIIHAALKRRIHRQLHRPAVVLYSQCGSLTAH